MFPDFHLSKRVLVALCSLGLLSSCVHKKYENPISKDTQQPDKILFDTAMKDIEHGRYEVARLSLQTLMNTYENSEYLAKAKLAVADSWYREGGANGFAQAEAEYKDFELFYPNMQEAPEAQERVCEIHFRQMDKSDRDMTQAIRAEDECRTLLVQYPNSKFAPEAAQRVREIQEVLADHEFWVGNFYWKRDMNPAAANRLDALVDQWPLYSKADEALYEAGDAYSQMGPRYRKKSFEMWDRIVRDYPVSDRADDAKKRLQESEQPVPNADPAALARMKYEEENRTRLSLMHRATHLMSSSPDVSHAAKEGQPTMTDPKRTIPASIPLPAGATETASNNGAPSGASTEVSAQTLSGSSNALDTKTDPRSTNSLNGSAPATDQNTNAPLPQNRDKERARIAKEIQKRNAKLQKKAKKKNADQPGATPNSTNGTGDNTGNGNPTTPASNSQTTPSVSNSAAAKNNNGSPATAQ